MTTTNTTGAVLSLLGGAAFARIGAERRPAGGISVFAVEVGRGEAVLASFDVTVYRGEVTARLTSGKAPPVVAPALVEAMRARLA